MAEFKEAKDNPLHRDFGLRKNTAYVLSKAKKYCFSALPFGFTDMLCGSLTGYFWGIAGKFVIDIIASNAPQDEKITSLIWAVAVIFAAALVVFGAQVFAGSRVWPRYIQIRMRVIHEREEKAMRLDYDMLERPEALDLHQRACNATGNNNEGFEGMYHDLQDMGKNLVTVIVAFTAVLVLDWRLILAIGLLAVVSFLFYHRTVKDDKKQVWDRLAPVWRQSSYMARVTQHFDYAKDVRLFSMQGFLLKKQRHIFDFREDRTDAHHNMWNRYAIFGQVLNVISRALVYTVLYFAVLSDEEPLSIGNFTLYLSLAMSFSDALIRLLQRFGDFSRHSMEVDDLRSFLELENEEPEDPLPVPETDEIEICFKDVSYRYHKSDKYAVEHLNLTLHPGERLAVVGLNGAGKTTMIKLLLRLYEPTEGSITLNGTDIRRFRREDYYRLFSPVFQNVEVFATSLTENISLLPADETDRSKAEDCLCRAGLEEKLASLPHGLDSEVLKVVSEEGIDLSGGEKQKLALARALYKGAPVVVLDEPTAALDALAEKQLYERFDGMIGKKSAVYISHRLASTRFCDHIAMFKDGKMCEYGTHEELMARHGEYAHMFEVQAQYYQDHPDGEEEQA